MDLTKLSNTELEDLRTSVSLILKHRGPNRASKLVDQWEKDRGLTPILSYTQDRESFRFYPKGILVGSTASGDGVLFAGFYSGDASDAITKGNFCLSHRDEDNPTTEDIDACLVEIHESLQDACERLSSQLARKEALLQVAKLTFPKSE